MKTVDLCGPIQHTTDSVSTSICKCLRVILSWNLHQLIIIIIITVITTIFVYFKEYHLELQDLRKFKTP
jgi:hypothetical protein